MIDQGIVQLGQPNISSNPLLTYSTHAVPPPAGGIHSIDFAEFEDRIHMLSWGDQRSESIEFDDGYGDDGVHEVFWSQQIHSHVVSVPGITPIWIPIPRLVTLPCYSVQTPFILTLGQLIHQRSSMLSEEVEWSDNSLQFYLGP